jgi:hypothetical protein
MDGGIRTDGFSAAARAASAPLLLWAAHFAFCYVAVAVGCTAVLQGGGITPQGVRWVLTGATALALGGGITLLWRACREGRRTRGDLLPVVRGATALLALVGMAWTGLAVGLVAACGA